MPIFMRDDCEALYEFNNQDGGLQIGLRHLKGTVAYCSDGLKWKPGIWTLTECLQPLT